MQLAQLKQQQADAEALRSFDPSKFYQTPQQQSLANGAGPTLENLAKVPTLQPKFDQQAMVQAMLASQSPVLKQRGLEMLTKDETPVVVGNNLVTRSGKTVYSAPPDPNKMSREDELRLQSELRRDERKVMASLSASNRPPVDNKPPSGYRYAPNGDLQAIPGGPADLKTQAEAQRKADGSTDVDVALSSLRDAYGRLEKGGGITSTSKSSLENARASLSSSALGQGTGKLFGTANQSARNDIAMSRPALLAAMMKATGMSAKQMDSNAELKLWLSTATDPTLDVEANRKALDNIERKYLGGKKADTGASGNWKDL
jgi:hypothetical protein